MRIDATPAERSARVDYRWVIVASSLILLIGSFGTQLTFGVFLKPLADEFGWSRASISGAMSLMMGVSGIIGVVMGRLSDRYRVRTVIAVGTVIGAIAYFLLTTTSSLWQFYLYFGVGGGVCVGSTYTPVAATISKWYVEKRALAIGIALMGISVGQMILSPVSAHLITTVGWKTTYMVLGVVVIVCAIPALVFVGRRAPSGTGVGSGVSSSKDVTRSSSVTSAGPAPSMGMTTSAAARTAPFWMMMVTGLVISAGFYIVAAHIVPAATDVGISTTAAALILTVASLGSIPGTILGSAVARRVGLKNTLMMLIAGEALGILLFIFTRSAWAFYVAALVFGFSFGGASPVRQAMAPPLFGLGSIGSILGFAFLAWSVGGVAGPYLAGAVFDLSQDYRIAFLIGSVLLLIGAVTVRLFGEHRTSDQAGREEPPGQCSAHSTG